MTEPSTSPDSRTGGQILVDALRIHGVDTAFCVPGESYLAVLDALYDAANEIRLITCRHEAGAANMAEAYGKLTGKPGVCLVARGPGACHASIGIHNASQDSTPMVVLVGQVARPDQDREAFQEIDFRRMFGSMTKWAGQVDQPQRIPEMVSRAFHIAASGRPGPVVLALPEDMLRERAETRDTGPYRALRTHPGSADMAELARILGAAERPVMVVGGGGWTPEACERIVAFAEANDLPTCCSFRRQDIFDNSHHNYIGDLGYAPDPALVERVGAGDVVLVVGARLGEIATQHYTLFDPPEPRQTLVHVHPEASILGRVYRPRLAIQSGMPEFAAAARELKPAASAKWRDWSEAARRDYLATLTPAPYDGALDLGRVMLALRDRLPPDAIIALDAGNFSGWAMRFLVWRRPRTLLGPQSGAMGYGVPAAVAAKILYPDRVVVGFAGDGGFLMSGQELATAVHYDAAPIILVFDNAMYGTVRMHQESDHPGRTIATDLTNPDFAALAAAYGAHGEVVRRTEDFIPAFERALDSGKAAVIDLKTDPEVITTRTTLSALREQALARSRDGK